jgi:hypothetical protein
MEGWYWRLTDAAGGRAIVVYSALCRARDGDWGFVGLAAHPGGPATWVVEQTGSATPDGRTLRFGDALRLDGDRLRVRVAGAELDAGVRPPADGWPRGLGGLGLGHLAPGLPQYWHPYALASRVSGTARLHGRTIPLDGWRGYAEKTWGPRFPHRWWWGQAHDFPAAPEVSVAFAGGPLLRGVAATACVVGLGDRVLRTWPPGVARVSAGRWALRARTGSWTIHLEGRADPAAALTLGVPQPLERVARPLSHQHLAGALDLRVVRRGATVFSGRSTLAGLEVEVAA